MFQSIMVPLSGDESDKITLETAYLAGLPFGAHIDCLWVRPDPSRFSLEAMTSSLANEATAALFLSDTDLRTEAARIEYAEFCRKRNVPYAKAPLASDGISADLQEMTGNPMEEAITRSRFHDLIVLTRGSGGSLWSEHGIGTLLLSSGRPILLAPNSVPEKLGATIAVAWKDTAEAARALAFSMPFLHRAHKVFVFGGDDDSATRSGNGAKAAERVATLLRWNGLDAEPHYVVPDGETLAQAILDTAQARGVDLLVMGAYGHSRARELVFGGVTRHILSASSLPVFMAH